MFFKVIACCVVIVCAGLILGCHADNVASDLKRQQVTSTHVLPETAPGKNTAVPTIPLTETPALSPAPVVFLTATPTIRPTETPPSSPTAVVFLTAAAIANGCMLPSSVILPIDGRGNVNPVLTGVSGPDERFCIMWNSDIPNATVFIVEISYVNGEIFTQKLSPNSSYTILPEHESPNCTDRISYQVAVYANVNENDRLVGGLAVNNGCR